MNSPNNINPELEYGKNRQYINIKHHSNFMLNMLPIKQPTNLPKKYRTATPLPNCNVWCPVFFDIVDLTRYTYGVISLLSEYKKEFGFWRCSPGGLCNMHKKATIINGTLPGLFRLDGNGRIIFLRHINEQDMFEWLKLYQMPLDFWCMLQDKMKESMNFTMPNYGDLYGF